MRSVKSGRHVHVWVWIGALLAVGMLVSVPVATQQAASEGALRATASMAGQRLVTPELQFPTARPDPAAIAAARQTSVAALLPKTSGGRRVPVIVGFDAAFVPEGRMTPAGVAAQREGLAAVGDTILAHLMLGSESVVKRFSTIPYFAAHVDADALQTLGGLQNVTSIVEDVAVPPTLNESTVIVQANQVWAAGVTGAGWNVAVLDTGVDKTHEMLAGGKVVSEACYSTTGSSSTSVCPGGVNSTAAGSGAPCSSSLGEGCGHGTHVSGIAAGNGAMTSRGLKGVAPGAGVIAIQVFSRFEISNCGTGATSPCPLSYTSDQILGLQRVLALAGIAKIASVNMSLGGGKYTSDAACDAANGAEKAAIDNLRSVNVATLIASGNNGYNDGISSPGCISTAVAVGSTTKAGAVSSFSNMRPGMVDLLAPGSSILSAYPGNNYVSWNGTSMATPHVAGAWALLKAVAELKGNVGTVTNILGALQNTGQPIVHAASGGTYREIRVFGAAVQIYNGVNPPGAPTGLTSAVSGSNISLSWTAPTTGGAPTAYTIEAGSGSGLSNLASFSTGNTSTTFFAGGIANGIYYLRVKATNSAGTSGPSNERIMVVGCASAPSAPGGLTITANGGGYVAFAWAAASGGPTTYILQAGSTPGLVNLANSDLGGTGTTYATSGVSPGTYYVRVKAANACGVSGASNEVTLVVAGVSRPGAPTNLVGSVLGAQIRLTWGASPAASAPASAATGYYLDAGSSSGASNLGTFDVGNVTSYVVDNVARGTYYLRVRGYNAAGVSGPSNEVVVLPSQGTGTGAMSATLTWNTGSASSNVDMDLHVIEPSGAHVYYNNKVGPTATLDFDNRVGLGPENIFVAPGRAATGTYQIYVHPWAGAVPTIATITIRTNVGTANERYTTFQRVFTVFGSSSPSQNVANVVFPAGTITDVPGTRAPISDALELKK